MTMILPFSAPTKRRQLFALICLLLTALYSEISAFADPNSPGNFFQNDFVNEKRSGSTLSKKQKKKNDILQPSNSPNSLRNADDRIKDLPEIHQDFFSPRDNDSKEALIAPNPDIPISKVALIINANDQRETFSMLKKYSDLIIEHNLSPESVYTLQMPQFPYTDAPFDWARIIIRGGTISFRRSLIEEYDLQQVPAWLLRTERGDVLLEGYKDIDKFLNAKGELKLDTLLHPKNLVAPEHASDTISEKEDKQ